jgi:processive 1,2-diacylglycerol beta-glucosyltransferase
MNYKRTILFGREDGMATYPVKVWIVYTNAGAGHRRAAEALAQSVAGYFDNGTVRLFDILDYATPIFRKGYPATYLFAISRCPWLWGWMYHLMNNRLVDWLARFVRRMTNAFHCRAFSKLVLAEKPDLVVTTHFLPNEIITHLKKRHGCRSYLATCITDYHPHRFWRDAGVDLYFIPNRDLAEPLGKMGIDQRKVRDTGIPIMPQFINELLQQEARAKLDLKDRFTLLITSGGFGVGPVKELVMELEALDQSIQVLVICGNNPKLQDELNAMVKRSRHRFYIYGYIDNMDELMAASDIMISKSGGLTTTEAMARAVPLIVLYPIPGQEMSNCRFLLEHDAGLLAGSPGEARQLLAELLGNPKRLATLRENIAGLGRPRAAQAVWEELQKAMQSKL